MIMPCPLRSLRGHTLIWCLRTYTHCVVVTHEFDFLEQSQIKVSGLRLPLPDTCNHPRIGNDMKPIMAVLMLLVSTSTLADKPVCPDPSFPACNVEPPGLMNTTSEVTGSSATVPEPGTLALMGLGLAMTVLVRARKRKR